MKIGILGLKSTGKSTVFSLLTDSVFDGSYKTDAVEKTAKVKDERIDFFSGMYLPKKTTYATLNFIDIPGFDSKSDQKEKTRILQMIQAVDSIILVVRAFESTVIPWPEDNDTTLKQLETLRTELVIRDMEVVENRLERLQADKKKKKLTPETEKEEALLERIKQELDNGDFSSKLSINDDEKKLISSLALLTLKPIIVLLNIDEEQLKNASYKGREDILTDCEKQNFAYLELCGRIESDLVELSPEEKEVFMTELGIKKPGIDTLSKIVYDHIGLISFFTVGQDEVRAWTIEKNTSMKKAAGKIHSDLEKGFVKAEVMKSKDLIEYKSEEVLKSKGLWKLAGKDEIVQDGDILNIRANT